MLSAGFYVGAIVSLCSTLGVWYNVVYNWYI